MDVRITFRSEVYVSGDTMDEIRDKFEDMQIFDSNAINENDAAFIELISVEDAETYEDLEREYYNCRRPRKMD